MPIPGTVPFTGLIAPTATTDTYPITDPIYGVDGLRSVADQATRDAIPAARRREGMLVYTQSDNKYWSLAADLTTWTEFTGGGGGGAASDVTYVDTTSGLTSTNVQDALDELTVLTAQANSPTGTWLISGGGVEWVSGYTFNVTAAQYYINGVRHSSPRTQVTLTTADPSLDRDDIIAVDNTGAVVVLTGTASPQPSLPDVDPQTTLALNQIEVGAATTEPDLATSLIYDENLGTPTEWAGTQSNATFNFASTINPHTGLKDVEGTAVANNHYFQFQAASSLDVTTYQYLNFYIRSKGAWGNKSLIISFRTTGAQVGTPVNLLDGQYGFSSSNTSAYQQITIPINDFAISAGTLVQVLRLQVKGGGPTIGFYFDTCAVQGGLGPLGTATGLTLEKADARYLLQSANLTDVASASQARTNLGVTDTMAPTFWLAIGTQATVGENQTNVLIAPRSFTITKAFAYAKTGPTGADLIFDINLNGTSIWSTVGDQLTILDGNVSATQTVFATTTVNEGDVLTIDIDQVGDFDTGQDITVTILGVV